MNLSVMEESVTILAGGEPVAVKGVSASGNYFQVLASRRLSEGCSPPGMKRFPAAAR